MELLLSTTEQAKSTLGNQVQTLEKESVQTLEKELIQKGVELEGLQQTLENDQQAHQALKDKRLQLKGYDEAMDQRILDELKVQFYEDFVQTSKPITTKAYSSTRNNLTKAFQVKVTQYCTQIQDVQSQLDEWMGPQDVYEEENEFKNDLGSVNLALVGVVILKFG